MTRELPDVLAFMADHAASTTLSQSVVGTSLGLAVCSLAGLTFGTLLRIFA